MEENHNTITGYIVDVINQIIYPGTITIEDGKIHDIVRIYDKCKNYILPGFVDSHIHIESSMMVPSEFARAAVVHGTIATVSDPHEIGNVLGFDGVKYMIENAGSVPLKFYFGAPSCVPASKFETSGAKITSKEIDELLAEDAVKCLGEMMDFPAVIMKDPTTKDKLDSAKRHSKLIDGHAPGLMGEDLKKYYEAGISTEHECLTQNEALEKLKLGMKLQIREGSAARNFDELINVLDDNYMDCMFCSDDLHPNDLVKGHLNSLVKRALSYGIDIFKVLQVASVNPVEHYGLDVGLLKIGDPADFIVVDNLRDINILKTYINGELVAESGKSLLKKSKVKIINNFKIKKRKVKDFEIKNGNGKINVIEALDGKLETNRLEAQPLIKDGLVISDVNRDILKLVVVNRYNEAEPTIGFVTNFGLKSGAIASSIAHDSHNIVAVGVTDEEICKAVNLIIEQKGGISAACKSDKIKRVLPLPIAGLMSDSDYDKISDEFNSMEELARSFGSKLRSPFSTLSFMALTVVPNLKLSDQGLFDTEKAEFIDVFEQK
jgi:adenine deaminase